MTFPDMLQIDYLLTACRNGALTPTDIVREVLARVHAYASVDAAVWINLVPAERLLARAAELEKRPVSDLPLYGVPFAVKDNIDVAGLPTTAACPAFAYDATESAEVVRRLEAAGAIVIGKTNLDQFATGLVGMRSPYGSRIACSVRSMCPVVQVPALPWRLLRGWCHSHWGPTRRAQGVCLRPLTTLWGLNPPVGCSARQVLCLRVNLWTVFPSLQLQQQMRGGLSSLPWRRMPMRRTHAPWCHAGWRRIRSALVFCGRKIVFLMAAPPMQHSMTVPSASLWNWGVLRSNWILHR